MSLPEPQRVVAEYFAFNASANSQELVEAERRMDDILARKNSITDKSTVGLLTLNATSIVGAFSALQAGPDALVSLGISPKDAALSISFFLFGSMLALIAVWWDGVQLNYSAAKHIKRLSALRKVSRILSSPINEKNVHDLGEAIEEFEKNPPIDFEYSKISIFLQNASGSLWLTAIGAIIFRVFLKHGLY